jgi:hypothetical protein
MHTGSARTLGDLKQQGEERLLAACERCGLPGNFAVAGLILRFGAAEQLPGLLVELFATCPTRNTRHRWRCGARYVE